MPYSPTVWQDNITLVDAAKMNHIEQGIAAAAGVNYKGDLVVPATTYNKGDIAVDAKGVSWICVKDGTNTPPDPWPGVTGNPSGSYSATPPASPNDGQIWYFPADVANGVIWMFRYNAASASAYKWEFVGGPPFYNSIVTQETLLSAAAWTTTATNLDYVTARAGDYVCTVNSIFTTGGAATQMWLAVANASINNNPIGLQGGVNLQAAGPAFNASLVSRLTAIPASQALRVVYYQSVTGAAALHRSLSVVPVRVS